MSKSLITINFFIFIYSTYFSQKYYYGINGYGRLTLNKNHTYYLEYVEVRIDSGIYLIKKDTLILNSNNKKIKQVDVDYRKLKQFLSLNGFYLFYEYNNKVSELLGTKLNLINLNIYVDTANNKNSYLLLFKDMNIKENSFFYLYSSLGGWYCTIQNNFNWNRDTIAVEFEWGDLTALTNTYFNNIRLLKKGKYLFPINTGDIVDYLNLNNDILFPYKRGNKKKKFKKHSMKTRYIHDYLINPIWFYDDIPIDWGVYHSK